MNEIKIRLLNADEIECRVGQCGKSSQGGWCSILLYKDARCDQRIMDEVFGIYGWKKSYTTINGNLFCTVSIYNPETQEWVDKQDVGTESNTEAKKGEASDAFKRACFCIGVGRELYTAPKIFINLKADEWYEDNGRMKMKANVVFTVTEISYDGKRNINALTIVDKSGTVRYKMGTVQATSKPKRAQDDDEPSVDEQLAYALPAVEQCNDTKSLEKLWYGYPDLHSERAFIDAVNVRKTQIENAA